MPVSQIDALKLQRSILELVNRIDALRPIHAVGIAEADVGDGFLTQVFVDPLITMEREFSMFFDKLSSENNSSLEVIVAPQCMALSSKTVSKAAFTLANQQVRSGASISLETETTEYGTLGYFCRPVNESPQSKASIPSYILSNSHVLSKIRTAPSTPGEMICLPAIADNGGRQIATFVDRTEIDLSATSVNPNLMDVAYASLLPGESPILNIQGLGSVKEILPKNLVKRTLVCRKRGRSTGITAGSVVSKNTTVRVKYDGDETWFADQIIVGSTSLSSPFCAPGDSGSLVVVPGSRVKAVGILFAGAVKLKDLTNKSFSALNSQLKGLPVKKLFNFGAITHISDIETKLKIKLELA